MRGREAENQVKISASIEMNRGNAPIIQFTRTLANLHFSADLVSTHQRLSFLVLSKISQQSNILTSHQSVDSLLQRVLTDPRGVPNPVLQVPYRRIVQPREVDVIVLIMQRQRTQAHRRENAPGLRMVVR
ncbi:Protein kinase of the PAK/Ste20 kinase family [Perkinsela sp. CCAP 1560/4]|nr:Protein kinase of the PAK/Ste20 kinase family [Perkinsela sp. CCAP 1560/4]|eukprot:KNH04231.1 Protein kinase of the PAK/Ste20 kinase family [Perkinsela sp. CCAP 1560/4]